MVRPEKIKCLLIDDDADDHEIFNIALSEISEDISFNSQINPFEAINLLQSGNFCPDIIFIDLNLPKMNGIDCIAELKKKNLIENIPIVFYSNNSDPNVRKESFQHGPISFLVKPVTINDLVEDLKNIFASEEFRRSLEENSLNAERINCN